MTVQTMNVSYISFSQNVVASTGTTVEQNFESFLATSETKAAEVKNDKAKVNVSNNLSDNKTAEITEAKEPAHTVEADRSLEETKVNEETKAEVTDVLGLSEDTEKIEILPEEVLAEILSILNEFVAVLQNELQVGEQDLLDAAEQIRFGMTDFFDADRVKDLFLQVNGAEASELLTDENLYKSLEEIQNMFSDILENSELYQLLEQEGILPEDFAVAAFKEQIISFAGKTQQVAKDTREIEIVIDFESLQAAESRDSVKVEMQGQDTGVQTVEAAQSDRTEFDGSGFEKEEHSQSDANQSQEQAGLFLQKLVSAAKSSSTEGIREVQGSFELHDIAAQIIEQVKLHIRPENTRMEIQLNPEQLGRVELEITSKNGELSARLNVQNDQVKEAVESQMQVLRDTLEAQGLKVENIEVTVAEFGFRFQDEQGSAEQSRQERRRGNTIDFEEAELEEQSFSDVAEVMKELNGNSVDYVA